MHHTASLMFSESRFSYWFIAWQEESPFKIIEFLNLITTELWIRQFYLVEGCSVHHRLYSSIHGLYPLDASSTPHPSSLSTTKNISRHCQMFPGGKLHFKSIPAPSPESRYATTITNREHLLLRALYIHTCIVLILVFLC